MRQRPAPNVSSLRRRFQPGAAALPYLLMVPTLLFVAVFTLYPSLRVVYDSLFLNNQAVQTPRFFAFGNYAALFADSGFRKSSSTPLPTSSSRCP
jgi:ABC-type sugar transport system permease subunit